MEQGLLIGFDLCNDYCRVSYYKENEPEPVDLVFSSEGSPYILRDAVCRLSDDSENHWIIGEKGARSALMGTGRLCDKLLRLCIVGGSATFYGKHYSADELMFHFLEETLNHLYQETGNHQISQIMFTLQELNHTALDIIIDCMNRLGIERKRVHIISHTESYLYFMLSQKRELWANMAVLYDLSPEGLNYYEMDVVRGIQPNIARASRNFLQEGFSADILDSENGRRMADNIMTRCVRRMLDKKLITSCCLSGVGMESCQLWGEEFLKFLCNRRRVFYVENLFAKGAVYAAMEFERETSAYPFKILCEGRIDVDISMEAYRNGRKTLMLCEVGDNWYETSQTFDLIPDQENVIRFKIRKLGEKLPKIIEVPLEGFPDRGNKLTRVSVDLSFISQDIFTVTVKDKGFGELFPATEAVVRKEFCIS